MKRRFAPIIIALALAASLFTFESVSHPLAAAACPTGSYSTPTGSAYVPSSGDGNQLTWTWITSTWTGSYGDCSGNSGWDVRHMLYTEDLYGNYTQNYMSIRVWICGNYQGDWAVTRLGLSSYRRYDVYTFHYPNGCSVQADDGWSSAYTPYGWGYIAYVHE